MLGAGNAALGKTDSLASDVGGGEKTDIQVISDWDKGHEGNKEDDRRMSWSPLTQPREHGSGGARQEGACLFKDPGDEGEVAGLSKPS